MLYRHRYERLLHCFDQGRNFIITIVSFSCLVFIHGIIVVDGRIGFCLQCINFGFLFVAVFRYASLAVLIIEAFLTLDSLRRFYPSPAFRTKFLRFAFKLFCEELVQQHGIFQINIIFIAEQIACYRASGCGITIHTDKASMPVGALDTCLHQMPFDLIRCP